MPCKTFYIWRNQANPPATCECSGDLSDEADCTPCPNGRAEYIPSADAAASPRTEYVSEPTNNASNRPMDVITGATPQLQIVGYKALVEQRGDYTGFGIRVNAEAGRYQQMRVRVLGRLPGDRDYPVKSINAPVFSQFETEAYQVPVMQGGRWSPEVWLECVGQDGPRYFFACFPLAVVFDSASAEAKRQELNDYIMGVQNTVTIEDFDGVLHSYKGMKGINNLVIKGGEGVISMGEINAEQLNEGMQAGQRVFQNVALHPVSVEEGRAVFEVGKPEINPRDALLQWIDQHRSHVGLSISLAKTVTRSVGKVLTDTVKIDDDLNLQLCAGRSGYLTLINLGTSGKLTLLSPNVFIRPESARIEANRDYALPGTALFDDEMALYEPGPEGDEEILALVTPHPVVLPQWLAGLSSHPGDWESGKAQPMVSLSSLQTDELVRFLTGLNDSECEAIRYSFRVVQ